MDGPRRQTHVCVALGKSSRGEISSHGSNSASKAKKMQGPNGRFASETAAWIKKWLKIPMLEILGGDWRYSKHSSTFL